RGGAGGAVGGGGGERRKARAAFEPLAAGVSVVIRRGYPPEPNATIRAMLGRLLLSRPEPGFTLPAFERLAPPPPPDLVIGRLEANSAPGHIVADLHGRGGWIARAAGDPPRRAPTLAPSPLTPLPPPVLP